MTSLGISTTSALQTENNEYSRQHVKVSQCKKSGEKNVDSIVSLRYYAFQYLRDGMPRLVLWFQLDRNF